VARVLRNATNSVRAVPEPQGMVNRGGSHGDDMEFDGASLTAPQPYEGDKREFPRCVAGSLRVRVEPKGDGRPNPMVGFLRLQKEEEVNLFSRYSH